MPRLTDDPVYLSSHFLALWGFTLGWGLRVWHRERLPPAGRCYWCAITYRTWTRRSSGWQSADPAPTSPGITSFMCPAYGGSSAGSGRCRSDRDAGKDGLAAVLRLLAEGKPVIMFPEGTRSPDGELQPLKPGVALLVKKAKCPVVPVGLVGAWESWPKGQILPVPAPLGVLGPGRPLGLSFGEPVPVGHYDRMGREDIVADLERRLAEAVADVRKRRR